MRYLGDFAEDATVRFLWSTNDAGGASITRATNGTVSVYKDNGVSQSTAGVTDTEDFDSLTGIHSCVIDTSADPFYATGADYVVVLSGATIDGQTVNAVLAQFSIENRYDVASAVSGAVGSVTGNVGGNVAGSVASVAAGVTLADDAITAAKFDESTAYPLKSADTGASQIARVGADGDTLETLSDQLDAVTTDTNELQTDLTDGGRLDLLVDAIKAKTDNLPAAPAATGDIPTAEANADAVWDETLSGHLGAGSTGEALNAAGAAGDPWTTNLPGAYGAGSAGYIVGTNLNAPVGTVDTVVDAIKAVTDNLPDSGALTTLLTNVAAILTDTGTTLDGKLDSILADTGTTLDGKIDAIAAYLDTEIAAILADTNELQTDLADGGRLDLLIDAVKAVTDALPEGGALTTLLANVAAILTDTGTTLPATLVGLATAADLATVDGVADAVKAVTDKLDDTLEDDAGTYRFTENALEQAPAGGGGGDATAANQTTIINHLTDVKGTGFVKDTNSLTNLSSSSPITLVSTTTATET